MGPATSLGKKGNKETVIDEASFGFHVTTVNIHRVTDGLKRVEADNRNGRMISQYGSCVAIFKASKRLFKLSVKKSKYLKYINNLRFTDKLTVSNRFLLFF